MVPAFFGFLLILAGNIVELMKSYDSSIFSASGNQGSLLTNKNNNLTTLILLRRASWLAVVPIALLQLTIAVHQFDHIADYIEGSCHVCVQLDRIDAAVDHPAEIASPHTIDFLRPAAPAVLAPRAPARNFDARAPPQL